MKQRQLEEAKDGLSAQKKLSEEQKIEFEKRREVWFYFSSIFAIVTAFSSVTIRKLNLEESNLYSSLLCAITMLKFVNFHFTFHKLLYWYYAVVKLWQNCLSWIIISHGISSMQVTWLRNLTKTKENYITWATEDKKGLSITWDGKAKRLFSARRDRWISRSYCMHN